MKKSLKTILVPGLALIICSIFLLQGHPSLSTGSFSRSRAFSYPDLISIDNDGNTFIVENGSKQITKLNPSGEIVFSIEGGKRTSGFYEAWNISNDSTGYFYIINSIRDIQSGLVLTEQIVRYTPKGVKDRILVDFSYSEKSLENKPLLSFGRIVSMKVIGDELCYLYNTDQGPELRRINLSSARKIPPVPLKNSPLIIDFTLHENSVYISQKNGKILRYSMDGKILPFRIAGNNPDTPFTIWTNYNGKILYSDIGRRGLMFGSETSSGTAFSRESYPGPAAKPSSFLVRNFSVSQNGITAFLDEANSRIVILNPDFSVKSVFENVRYKASGIIFIILYLTALITAVAVVVYFLCCIFHFIVYTRFRLLTKFSTISTTVFISVGIIITMIGLHETGAIQDKGSMENLKQTAYIMASAIDAEALKRVNLPEHYLNRDYRVLQNRLNDLVFPDNSGMYALLYKEHGGNLYYTVDMTGYYGTRYPYTKAQNVHRQALNGKTGCTTYKDYEGDWMIGVSPVKDASGNIVGILEVGINHFVEEEIWSAFSRKIIIIVGCIILFASMITLLGHYYLLRPLKKIIRFISSIGGSGTKNGLSVSSGDEFQDLAAEVSSLTGRIFSHLSEVREKSSKSENLDTAKKMFIVNTVHELKTPLNGISGITESIIEQSGDTVSKKVKSELNLILLSTKRLSSMINEIINYSDTMRETILELSEVNVSDMISLVRSVFIFSSKDREIVIEYTPASATDIRADRMKLEKALFSVIGYALSVSHEQKCEITFSQEAFAEIGIRFDCEKPDPALTGMFAHTEQERVFSPETGGDYLYGIYTASEILRLHRGSLTMRHENGMMTFTMKIFSGN
jgi:signal transduction histidine kinase